MKFFINFSDQDALVVHDNVVFNLYAGEGEPLFRLKLRPPFEEALESRLKGSDVFVYALTPASLTDDWCTWLYRRAVDLEIPVAPVQVLNCDVPSELRTSGLISLTSVTHSSFPFGIIPGFVTSGVTVERGRVPLPGAPPAGPPPHARIARIDLNSGTAGLMMGLNGINLNGPDARRQVSAYFGGA